MPSFTLASVFLPHYNFSSQPICAWYLGGLARSNPQPIGALGWMFFAVQLVSLILCWKYFLPPPVVLSRPGGYLHWLGFLVGGPEIADKVYGCFVCFNTATMSTTPLITDKRVNAISTYKIFMW
jgi:hypothetical protein